MHHIQAKILAKLLYAEHCNYSQMRPAGVESNHFAYHLEQLVKQKLIVKTDGHYSLSVPGLAAIDRLSHVDSAMTDRLQPHIVTAIDLTNKAGQTLLFKRYFQPYINLTGFPMGKVHYEEDVMTAALRELEEKTGLTGIPLNYRGSAYIEAKRDGQTISKVFYHVLHGEVDGTPETVTPAHRGTCFWTDAATYPKHELMPGFTKIKALLETHDDLFFTEITEDLGSRS